MRNELVSKVTAKAQTTLPSGVRKALAVGPGDSLRYRIEGHRAIIEKDDPASQHADPAVGAFLTFLADDLSEHPGRLRGVPRLLLRRARALARGITIDHTGPIEGSVAL
ncbi:MAG: type II toxin-antitoxin system PrlF family antitoxin [Gemmatimonadales bacterium]|nr:type II toxin-antitoxin system PrlF family antitoxin [Gemmatimonadales bacterium]MBA3553387.1 type II toxin-antitoxin system PrlF family antitoxin [Gemmatimonadales bacterium]